jgi:tetratricopeptide (TPR) repeat protein
VDTAAPDEIFVDRDAELGQLDRLLDEAMAGSGRVVFVTGESGIGKTALVQEFLQRTRRRGVVTTQLRGRCLEQYGPGEAYLPILDALGRVLSSPGRERTADILRKHAPTWCLHLPASASDVAPARKTLKQQTVGATKERMIRELADALEASAHDYPLITLLEDLQWADPSSIDVLRHVGSRIVRRRMLILATYRPGVETQNDALSSCAGHFRIQAHGREIPLSPLGPRAVVSYLDARFRPNRFPSQLGEMLHAKTEGHPLFVVHLTRYLEAQGDLVWSDDHWKVARTLPDKTLEAPQGLRDLIRAKFEALADEDRTALGHASVMGLEFLSAILARLLGADELQLEERLDRLGRAHHFIERAGAEDLPDGSVTTRYRFSHSLEQAVLYKDLGTARRSQVHREAAQHLARSYGAEAGRIAPSLALHFELGRDFASAATYQRLAAEKAASVFAHDEAHEHVDHALGLLSRLPLEAQARHRIALDRVRGELEVARSRFDLAAHHFAAMRSQARGDRALEDEFAALSGLCNALFFANRIEEMAIRTDEALEVAARSGDPSLRLEGLVLVAQVLQDTGDLQGAEPLLGEIESAARRLDHKRALLASLFFSGPLHYWQTEYERALAHTTEAFDLAREQQDGFKALGSLMFLGLSRGNLGHVSEALRLLREGLEMGSRNGDRYWRPRFASHQGWLHRELLDFAQAVAFDEEGLRLAREAGARGAEASALLNLAFDHTQSGDLERAGRIFAELAGSTGHERLLAWHHAIRCEQALAAYRLRCGDVEDAGAHAGRLLDAARRHGTRTYEIAAEGLLAEVAESRDDVAAVAIHVDRAMELLGRHPSPHVGWRTHVQRARLRSRLGDAAAARDDYARAEAFVDAIAEHTTDETLRATFLSAAAVRVVRDGARGRSGP